MSDQRSGGPILLAIGIICCIGVFAVLKSQAPEAPPADGDPAVGTQSTGDTEPSSQDPEGAQQESDAPENSGVSSAAESAGEMHQEFPDAVSTKTDDRPVWEKWPKPQLAFLLTVEQHGYFEPCGCTANQLGGMSRRADLLNKLQEADWEVRGLDAGGLPRRRSQQAAMKLDTTMKALHKLQYLAVGLSTEELQLGVEKLLEVHMNLTNMQSTVPFVSSNVRFLDGALDGFPLTHRIVEVAGVKVGVTAVLSDQLQQEVFPLAEASWSEPEPAIESALKAFDEEQVDVRVLLSQSEKAEAKSYAEKFPAFDFILTTRGVGDPDPTAAPEQIGNTLIIEPGRKGKYVGVLGVYPEAEKKLRYQLVSLERDDFDDTESMVQLMQKYQQELKDFEVAKTDVVSAAHPSGATFVGADKCGECHTEAYEIWARTPHAHALESLDPVHKRKGHERLNGINRSFDPECLACHVTGWDPQEYIRFQSGFLNEEFAETDEQKTLQALLAGSQCENCHGPGSAHIAAIEAGDDDAGKSVRVTLAQAKESTCTNCHDADNSPHFEFDTYWPKVEHYGLD